MESVNLSKELQVEGDINSSPPQSLPRKLLKVPAFFALLIFPFGLLWFFSLAPSRDREVTIDIPSGSSVRAISELLYGGKIIRSPELFRIIVRLEGKDTALPAGVFMFSEKKNVFSIISQLTEHERGIARQRITVPEGYTVKQIAALYSEKLPYFDSREFESMAGKTEGYLFPDTYFFFTTATSGVVMETMQENFHMKTKELYQESVTLNKPWHDIVVMASIIEEETVLEVDRKIVSGILWNRIKIGMRLQVDASFAYLMNKASSEITLDDLNSDSPYNTYRYAGLPPAPIANPGLATISAALHPTQTAFLYYLSDEDGNMHYAKTFDEHKLNKARYLR